MNTYCAIIINHQYHFVHSISFFRNYGECLNQSGFFVLSFICVCVLFGGACIVCQCMMHLERWVATLKEVTPTSLACCSSVALPTVPPSLGSTVRCSLGR